MIVFCQLPRDRKKTAFCLDPHRVVSVFCNIILIITEDFILDHLHPLVIFAFQICIDYVRHASDHKIIIQKYIKEHYIEMYEIWARDSEEGFYGEE